MGRREKGQSQRNPLPPQASPRLPTGFGGGRRPPESRTTSRHPDTSPPADPTAGPHRTGNLGSSCRSLTPEPGSHIILPRLKCQGDMPAPPPPQTRTLAAPQQEQLTHPPHHCWSAPTLTSSPRPKPFGTSSRCQGPRSTSALRSLLCREDHEQRAGAWTARQMTRIHREAP